MNIPERFWKFSTVAVAVLIAFLAAIAVKTFREVGYVGSNPGQSYTVDVNGTGEAFAVPDVATFSFSVIETAKEVAPAQQAATDRMNAALKAIRAAGIADKDIQTQSYNINPRYEYQNAVCPRPVDSSVVYCPPGKSIITGYEVSQSVAVKVRDLSKAGAIFSSIGALGVENVNGLSFSVDKPEAVQAEARAKAIAAAQAKARELARQLGVSLGRIVSFSESGGDYPRPVYYAAGAREMKASAAVAPEVPTGEQKIISNVSIVYEIR